MTDLIKQARDAVYLDPDYRRDPDTSKPWCERCQKPIKDTSKAIKVTTLDVQVWRDPDGKGWIGIDCARIIGLK